MNVCLAAVFAARQLSEAHRGSWRPAVVRVEFNSFGFSASTYRDVLCALVRSLQPRCCPRSSSRSLSLSLSLFLSLALNLSLCGVLPFNSALYVRVCAYVGSVHRKFFRYSDPTVPLTRTDMEVIEDLMEPQSRP